MKLQETPVYLGRQPILNQQQQLVAYELLFRNSPRNAAGVGDGTLATATVVANAFSELGLGNAMGCLHAFVNVDTALLVDDAIELLPSGQVVLEILEQVPPTAEIVARLEELRLEGFQLALDDFSGASDPRLPLLPLVDIVKIDLVLVDAGALASVVSGLRQRGSPGLRLLAEKIDSPEQLRHCQELGFDLYQGYYFAKPAIITGRRLDNSKLVLLKLMALVLEDADTALLETSFKQAPGLSINLLRLVNSVASGLRVRISSLRHAITILGRRQLQRWLQLLLYTDPSGQATLDNPLLQLAATRGRLMELLAQYVARNDERLAEHGFMAGVMSLTPALFGMPLPQVLAQVNLATPICDALVNHKGRLGQLLAVVEAMEQEDIKALTAPLRELPMLHPENLSAALAEAMAWSAAIGREPADD